MLEEGRMRFFASCEARNEKFALLTKRMVDEADAQARVDLLRELNLLFGASIMLDLKAVQKFAKTWMARLQEGAGAEDFDGQRFQDEARLALRSPSPVAAAKPKESKRRKVLPDAVLSRGTKAQAKKIA